MISTLFEKIVFSPHFGHIIRKFDSLKLNLSLFVPKLSTVNICKQARGLSIESNCIFFKLDYGFGDYGRFIFKYMIFSIICSTIQSWVLQFHTHFVRGNLWSFRNRP